jgi:hypothetical protein
VGAQKIVAEQKRRIAGLRIAGASTFDAAQALSAFESNLRLFTEHRDALLSTKVDLEGDLARPRRRYSDLNRFRDELLRVRSPVQE